MTVFVKTVGQGKTDLVLLHGWGLNHGIWQNLVNELQQDFCLHLIDLPGFGGSAMLQQEYDLKNIAQAVLSVAPEQAIWLGWSLGGMVAKQIAIDHPEKVLSLITIASSPKFSQTEDWQSAMQQQVLQKFADELAIDFKQTLSRFLAIQSMGSATQKQDIQLLKQVVFQHGEPHIDALTQGLQILQQADLRHQLHNIQCDWLRIYGALDALVPKRNAQAVQTLAPNSQQQIVAKASHAPFISHTAETAQYIRDFIHE